MYSLKSLLPLAILLPALVSAYELRACTDYGCSENCVDLSAADPSGNGPCIDLGINALSVYWYDAGAPLDAWAQERAGCLSGTGSEDAQFSNGNTADGACNGLENSAWAQDGVRYVMYANDAF